MKRRTILTMAGLMVAAGCVVGCGESLPVNPTPANGANPHVSGTPQERIERIQSDATLTPEEKERRIQIIKERNGIK